MPEEAGVAIVGDLLAEEAVGSVVAGGLAEGAGAVGMAAGEGAMVGEGLTAGALEGGVSGIENTVMSTMAPGEGAMVGPGLQTPADLLSSAAPGGIGAKDILGTLKTAATILSPISSIMGAASGISASKKMGVLTAPPAVTPPVTMPILGSGASLNSLRSNIQDQLMRRGRAATILTDQGSGDRLGS